MYAPPSIHIYYTKFTLKLSIIDYSYGFIHIHFQFIFFHSVEQNLFSTQYYAATYIKNSTHIANPIINSHFVCSCFIYRI